MSKIVLFGECMVELFHKNDNSIQQAFAGDVFNTAVYLKRGFAQFDVSFVSAIGLDLFSQGMLKYCESEEIDTEYIYQLTDKSIGLYSIQTDDLGERTFTYWRNDSAARQVMSNLDKKVIEDISEAKLFYFSGISLAILDEKNRALFWSMLKALKQSGVQIVFDTNYRVGLWESIESAKKQFELALEMADIALPGMADFSELYHFSDTEQVLELCHRYSISEIVIKNGDSGILSCIDEKVEYFSNKPVEKVVDTTSAGDSFNGLYLGARTVGLSARKAIEIASAGAAFVIQHEGAIMPLNVFQTFVNSLPLEMPSQIASASQHRNIL